MKISFVVAIADNDVIGINGGLPWDIPGDMKFFKDTTMGHPIIMGRKTHESIGRPLPGRHNIVVTRNTDYHAEGCTVVNSMDAAFLLAARETEEAMVIGGAEVYNLSMDQADRIYLTEVHATPSGDATFDFDRTKWSETSRKHFAADGDAPAYSIVVLDRA